MNGKARIIAVLAIAGLVASLAMPALGQEQRWSGARSYRRPSPPSPGERPRSPGEMPPARHGDAPPRPIVVQLKHISVESYMQTLEQLGRNSRIREALAKVPHAVNEEANAVVFIGTREVAELFMGIAAGLDRPNEFRIHRQEMEMRERMMDVKMEQMKRSAHGGPHPPPAPHGSSRGYSGHFRPSSSSRYRSASSIPSQHHRGWSLGQHIRERIERYRAAREAHSKSAAKSPASSWRERIERYRASRRPEPAKPAARPSGSTARSLFAAGMKVKALTSSGMVRQLELSDEQVKRIRDLAGAHAGSTRQLFARVRSAIEGVPAEQRRKKYDELRPKVEAELAKRGKALNAKILGLMAGKQRAAAAKFLGVSLADDKPAPRAERTKPEPEPKAKPKPKAKPRPKAKPKGKKPKRR